LNRLRIILETERLQLREFTREDTPFIIELLNSPGWLQYIGDRNVRAPEQALTYLENGPIMSYATNGYGLWMVRLKKPSTPVGMCGILKRTELSTPDIGYALLPAFHGKGYADEIVSATLRHAHEDLNIPVLSAIVQPDNARSIHLLKKKGFVFERLFSFSGKDEVLELHREGPSTR
jgi:RimJ/RimL family protein N-acetyltransferase